MSKTTICDFCGAVGKPRTPTADPSGWASIRCSSYGFTGYVITWNYDVCPKCKESRFSEIAKDDEKPTLDTILRELVEEVVQESMEP